jgi:hypothetical protein
MTSIGTSIRAFGALAAPTVLYAQAVAKAFAFNGLLRVPNGGLTPIIEPAGFRAESNTAILMRAGAIAGGGLAGYRFAGAVSAERATHGRVHSLTLGVSALCGPCSFGVMASGSAAQPISGREDAPGRIGPRVSLAEEIGVGAQVHSIAVGGTIALPIEWSSRRRDGRTWYVAPGVSYGLLHVAPLTMHGALLQAAAGVAFRATRGTAMGVGFRHFFIRGARTEVGLTFGRAGRGT